jgi:hypothetical protein
MPTEPIEAANGADEARGADLLTIGLLVFFVALLVTVAALLILPLVFG